MLQTACIYKFIAAGNIFQILISASYGLPYKI